MVGALVGSQLREHKGLQRSGCGREITCNDVCMNITTDTQAMTPPSPAQIVDDPSLDVAAKVEILRQLEYDVRQHQVAVEEGMDGGSPLPSLKQIRSALARLGSEPSSETPTKS